MAPKVVLLCRVDGNFGGVERNILTLAHGFDKSRYTPVIVGLGQEGELLRQGREAGIETEFISMKSRLQTPRAAGLLAGIAHNRQADLLHTFGLRSNMIAAWIRRFHKINSIPWMIRLPNINSTDYRNPLRSWFSHGLNNALIRRADALQVISPQLKAYMESLKNRPTNIFTIFNGVDPERFDPSLFNRSIRADHKLNEDTVLLGSVGRLDSIKAYDILINAFADLKHECDNLALMLVGDGPQRPTLQKMIDDYNLQDSIFITGFKEDVRPYLAAFDIYVCSSHSEGVPMAMLEAMSMALPVVSTRVGGIESLIEEDSTGALIPAGNMDALIEAIKSFLSDRDKMQVYGNNARQSIIQKFSVQRMVQSVEQMYDDMIEKKSNE